MSKEIELTQGKFAIVDDDDYEELNKTKWYAWYTKGKWYAKRTRRDHKVFMHNQIMNTPKGMEVDHIDGDSLNNQKENLRICTHSENMMNRKVQKNNKTGIRGVKSSKSGKYIATIYAKGKCIHLGTFEDAEGAKEAYQTASKKYYGIFS